MALLSKPKKIFEDHKIMKCDLIKMDIEGTEFETLYNI